MRGAGIAMHEEHGLGGVLGTGLDHRRRNAADRDPASPRHAYAATDDGARRSPSGRRPRLRFTRIIRAIKPGVSIFCGGIQRLPIRPIRWARTWSRAAPRNSIFSIGLKRRPLEYSDVHFSCAATPALWRFR